MKSITYTLSLMVLMELMTACGSGSNNHDALLGSWTLVGLESEGEREAPELTNCDQQTKWEFTSEPDEPLGDGTEVMKLKATAPDGCKFFGFESKWTMKDGQVFISTSRIGGMGGLSNAGMFDIVELSAHKLVLKTLGYQYTFEK